MTLKDLKDKIDDIENSLPSNISLSDIPLKPNYYGEYNEIDIEIYDYLGFLYSSINLKQK